MTTAGSDVVVVVAVFPPPQAARSNSGTATTNLERIFIEVYGEATTTAQTAPTYSDPVTYEETLTYCLSKPGAWEDMPWEESVVVKVAEKIFAFLGSGTSVGVKCGRNRDEADEWLLRYPEDASVMAYIGRSGWNTLRLNGAIPDDELREAIDDSYATIVSKLPKCRRPPASD